MLVVVRRLQQVSVVCSLRRSPIVLFADDQARSISRGVSVFLVKFQPSQLCMVVLRAAILQVQLM